MAGEKLFHPPCTSGRKARPKASKESKVPKGSKAAKESKESRATKEPKEPKPSQTSKAHHRSIEDDLICPISLELPVDPVMAEDGRIYERDHINRYFLNYEAEEQIKSPMTNEPMGKGLISAHQIKNHIETLINYNVITGDIAIKWKKRNMRNQWKDEAMNSTGQLGSVMTLNAKIDDLLRNLETSSELVIAEKNRRHSEGPETPERPELPTRAPQIRMSMPERPASPITVDSSMSVTSGRTSKTSKASKDSSKTDDSSDVSETAGTTDYTAPSVKSFTDSSMNTVEQLESGWKSLMGVLGTLDSAKP